MSRDERGQHQERKSEKMKSTKKSETNFEEAVRHTRVCMYAIIHRCEAKTYTNNVLLFLMVLKLLLKYRFMIKSTPRIFHHRVYYSIMCVLCIKFDVKMSTNRMKLLSPTLLPHIISDSWLKPITITVEFEKLWTVKVIKWNSIQHLNIIIITIYWSILYHFGFSYDLTPFDHPMRVTAIITTTKRSPP